LDCIDFDWDNFRRPFCADAFSAVGRGRFVFAVRFAVRDLPVRRFAARIARPAVRLADVAVLLAARLVVRAADRAAVIVDRVAFSAACPMARGEVKPVICAARSTSCPIPSTPAAKPRPTTVAPDSMIPPTVCADCSIAELLSPLVAVVSFVAISPPGAFVMNACRAVAVHPRRRTIERCANADPSRAHGLAAK
jgi:hypothetical protein